MTEALFLTIRAGRWNAPRISKVSKRAPRLTPGHNACVVRINVSLPNNVLIPRVPVATVEIKQEHITPPSVTVTAEAAQ